MTASAPPAIVGPTASGKTAVAIELAQLLGGEVVSMDSRQAYRGFAVGTAAPSRSELAAAPHHGVGFLDPWERYGAGRFARRATEWISGIERRGAVPILAGGAGLFLRSLTHPIFKEPAHDPRRRAKLRDWLARTGREELRGWATRLDRPLAAAKERPLDRQRAARTTELALLTGRSLSWWIAFGEPERPPLRTATYVLELPPELLRQRIRSRAELMIDSGSWPREVSRLLARGLEESPAFNAVGYADVASFVREEASARETIDRVVAASWSYARRQRTWFRHQLPGDAVALDAAAPPKQLAHRIASEHERRQIQLTGSRDPG